MVNNDRPLSCPNFHVGGKRILSDAKKERLKKKRASSEAWPERGIASNLNGLAGLRGG